MFLLSNHMPWCWAEIHFCGPNPVTFRSIPLEWIFHPGNGGRSGPAAGNSTATEYRCLEAC
jgi:hypothetical protein